MIALALTLKLLCTSELGVTIHVNAQAIDTETYMVQLQNKYMEDMNVDQKKITFNEQGDMTKIETSYLWEALTIEKGPEGWGGLYMYDLGYYPLRCSIQN